VALIFLIVINTLMH